MLSLLRLAVCSQHSPTEVGAAGQEAASVGWKIPRSHLKIALGAAVLAAPLLGYEVFSLTTLRQERQQELEAEAGRLLALVNAEQRRSVEDIRHIFATLQATGVPHLPADGCLSIMRELKRSYPSHLEIQVADRNGYVWCGTEVKSVGTDIGDLPSFREALQNDGLVVGEAGPLRATANARGRTILPYRQRYLGVDGQPGGTMTALIDLDWLKDYVAGLSWPSYAVVTIVHPDGQILARAPMDRGLVLGSVIPDRLRYTLEASTQGSGRSPGLDMVERRFAFLPPKASASGLMLAVAVDPVEALRPIDRSAAGSFAAFMVLLGLVFTGGAYGTSRLAIARRQEAAAAARMSSVLESTSDAVAEIESDWTVSYLNPQARDLLGLERDVIGEQAQVAFDWLTGSELETRLRDTMDRRTPVEFEFLGPRTRRWFALRVFPSRKGVAIYFRDITEQRAAEDERRALAGHLEHERFLLRAINDSLPIGLLIIEAPSGRLLMHNPASEQLIGHSITAVSGVADYSRYGGLRANGAPLAADEYPPARALRGEVVSQEELHYRRGDGSTTTFLVEAVPIRGADDRVELVVVAFHDISRRKAMEEALRESERTLSAALASARAGTWTWDILPGEISWSPGNYLIHGMEPRDGHVRFAEWLAAVHPEDRSEATRVVRKTLASRRASYDVEYRVVLPDGGIRWVAGIGKADYDEAGQPVWMSGLTVDITDRKAMEVALRAAKEESDRANRAKARFLAAASHDLRQPLQSMALFGGALHAHVKDERGKDMLLMLERGTETMKALLDSLLDVSRLDAGVVNPQLSSFDLDTLIKEIADSYRPLAATKGLSVSTDGSCSGVVVRSDRTMLGRIIRNLVENAVRYTERGVITASCRIDNENAWIDVADTGIGIPEDQIAMIFNEFHQVGNPERDRSRGLGLGLSIVQRLSRILDHEVRVRSRLGEGSVFSIQAPIDAGADVAEAVSEDDMTPLPVGRGRLALVIDDDTIVLMSLRTLLEEWGYDTLIAGSSEQAVTIVTEAGRRPDVIVADYRLRAGRNGCEAIRDVRSHLGLEIPGVILTGETGAECARDIAQYGLGMIHKPVMPGQLWAALERLLGSTSNSRHAHGADFPT